MKLQAQVRPTGLERFCLIAEMDKPFVQKAVTKALPKIKFEIADKIQKLGASLQYFTVIFQIENVDDFNRVITFIENEGNGQGLSIKVGNYYMEHGTYKNVFTSWKTLREVGEVLF